MGTHRTVSPPMVLSCCEARSSMHRGLQFSLAAAGYEALPILTTPDQSGFTLAVWGGLPANSRSRILAVARFGMKDDRLYLLRIAQSGRTSRAKAHRE